MKVKRWTGSLLVAGVLAGFASDARADRTPTARSSGQRSTGARSDITVPYLSSGKSAFMSRSVGPQITSSPSVGDPKSPQKPVFNIIFYGAQQGFGKDSNGAMPKR